MRVPLRSIRRWVKRGILPSIKIQRLVRVPTSDFLDVLEKNRAMRELACLQRQDVSHDGGSLAR